MRMRARETLSEFVRDGLRAGHSIDALRATLERAGWPALDIEAALSSWMDDGLRVPVPLPRPSPSGRELVVFGLFAVTLVVMIWHLVQLSFALIEIWIPDPDWPDRAVPSGSIRWSISALVVMLPLFVWLTYRVETPARGKSRRHLSPLQGRFGAVAVLLSILVLLGSAVAVVYAGLTGDLTAQFLAKAAVVVAVCGLLITWFRGNTVEV
jgi:hypothetical protein